MDALAVAWRRVHLQHLVDEPPVESGGDFLGARVQKVVSVWIPVLVLTPAQVWQLSVLADDYNLPVMCYGLRTDFQGKLFPGSAELLAIADVLREIRTICHCGRKASMVIRQSQDGTTVTDGAQIEIGGNDKYVSLCRKHWKEATRYEHAK